MVLVGAGRLLVASRDSAGRLLMCLQLVFGLAFERSADLPGFPKPARGSETPNGSGPPVGPVNEGDASGRTHRGRPARGEAHRPEELSAAPEGLESLGAGRLEAPGRDGGNPAGGFAVTSSGFPGVPESDAKTPSAAISEVSAPPLNGSEVSEVRYVERHFERLPTRRKPSPRLVARWRRRAETQPR
jgi:hypothetical protein